MVHRTLSPTLYARAEAILEAIVWAADGDDIPSAIELVFLANDDNWTAAHGEADAIASRWLLRRQIAS
jgi:hypothetical protein